jgi:hypothetical protein
MAIFTAIAAAVTTAIAGITWTSVAAFAARTIFAIGVSKLISDRKNKKAAGSASGSAGARIQLPPATNNKLPVIYGRAFVAPVITDAKISTDQKEMWYVCALSEVTDTGSISFGNMYWGGKLITFDIADASKVVSLTNNAGEVDDRVDGNLYIWKYNDGSFSPVNTGATAISILQNSNIPSAQRWTSNNIMFKTVFCIVYVKYNQDANLTNLETLNVELINSLDKPGSVMKDYFTNARYGCGIPLSSLDTSSFTLLDTYSDQLITYVPVGGGSATQARYRINGPIDTGTDCFSNLQDLADSCDSWIQYSELTAQWRVVINKAEDESSLFVVDSSNLISGIDISPIDLNQTYTSVEVQYPNRNIKDQMAYATLKLIDYVPSVMSPNEPNNQLSLQFPYVNNAVQAQYLGVRRLLQSREDLTITCSLDYSGIVLEAGDVVKVTLAEYGWTNKLFRISQVQELKDDLGNLGVRISGFEYNATIYNDNAIQDYIPAANTGLSDPNIISQPYNLTVTNNPDSDGNISSFTVTITSPASGAVLYLDFNYGTSSTASTHKLYRTVSTGNGVPYPNNTVVSITVNDLPPNTYYWSVTARNNSAGRLGNSSGAFVWPGMNVTSFNPGTGTGGIINQQIQNDAVSTRKVIGENITTTAYVEAAPNATLNPQFGGTATEYALDIIPGFTTTVPAQRIIFLLNMVYSVPNQATNIGARMRYRVDSGIWITFREFNLSSPGSFTTSHTIFASLVPPTAGLIDFRLEFYNDFTRVGVLQLVSALPLATLR